MHDNNRIAKTVWISFFALTALVGIVVLINNQNSSRGPSNPKSKTPPTHISGPTTGPAIAKIALDRGLFQFFWLGNSTAANQARIDLTPRPNQVEVGYLNRKAQTAFSSQRPVFTTLVVTQPYAQKSSLKVLQHLASETIHRPGFSVYLPPARFLNQKRLFAVSDDLQTVGIIISNGPGTLPALRKVAEQVSLYKSGM